jgi:hypothetical protein
MGKSSQGREVRNGGRNGGERMGERMIKCRFRTLGRRSGSRRSRMMEGGRMRREGGQLDDKVPVGNGAREGGLP